jgi:hypothetical protein
MWECHATKGHGETDIMKEFSSSLSLSSGWLSFSVKEKLFHKTAPLDKEKQQQQHKEIQRKKILSSFSQRRARERERERLRHNDTHTHTASTKEIKKAKVIEMKRDRFCVCHASSLSMFYLNSTTESISWKREGGRRHL